MIELTIIPVDTPALSAEDRGRMNTIASGIRELMPGAIQGAAALCFQERRAAAHQALTEVTQKGDELQYGDASAGPLAQIVATLALQPGGTTTLGHHWCVQHTLCEQVEHELNEEGANAP